MKKILAMALSVVMMASLAGCGGGSSSGEKVTLKIGMPNGASLTPASILEGFKAEYPDINVEIDETPWSDFGTKLTRQIASGDAPAVFIVDSGTAASLGGKGAAVDLTDRIKGLNLDDYTSALDPIKDGEGHTWGVTHSLASAAVLYNKDLFDKYGVAYPEKDWTFEDMIEIAKKLTIDENGDGVTDIYGLSSGGNITTGWLPFILSTGGAPLNETKTASNFLAPETVEGVTKYYDTVNTLKISPTFAWNKSNGNHVSAFYSGRVAMIIDLWGTTGSINKAAPEGFNYDAQMMPIGWNGERNCIYVPNQWVMYSRATEAEQDAAWKWIEYYLSETSQDAVANEFTTIGFPVRKSALEKVKEVETVPANSAAFYEGLDEFGITLFENECWSNWRSKVEQALLEMQNGAITPQEAVERADAAITEAING